MKKEVLIFFQIIFCILSSQLTQSQKYVSPENVVDDIIWLHIGSIDMSAVKENYQADSLAYQKAQQKIIDIKYQLSQNKKKDPLNKPKDPFETTEDYNQRLKKLDDKYNNLITEETALFDQQIMSFRNSSYMTKSNVNIIFSLDKYDADNSRWLAEISENGVKKNVSINIDPNQARLLWSNISQIKVNEIKKLSNPTDRFLIIFYNNNTNPIHLQSYRNKKTYDSNGESVFTKVEVDASFPGGMGAWTRFLANNLESTLPGENGANPGVYTVMVRFIVNKDGSVSDVQAETNHGYGMEQEAIRVIKKSGRWTPAIQNGRNVTAYKRQSMTWSVAE